MYYHASNKYCDVFLSKFYMVLLQFTSWLSQIRRFCNNPITIDLFWLVTTHSLVDGTDIPKWTVSTLISELVVTSIWTQHLTPKHWYSATKQHYVTFQKNCLYNHRNRNLKGTLNNCHENVKCLHNRRHMNFEYLLFHFALLQEATNQQAICIYGH